MLNFCRQILSCQVNKQSPFDNTTTQHNTTKGTRQQHMGIMAPNKDPDDPYHHRQMCWGKVSNNATHILPVCFEMLPARANLYMQHRKGHWCWTDAEIESLKHQAGVLHLEWPSIAKVSVLVFRASIGTRSQY